jgi:hypothetical protein
MLEPLRPNVPGSIPAWEAERLIGKKAMVDMPYGMEFRWENISA